MATLLGRTKTLSHSATDASYTAIVGITDVSLNISSTRVDTTSHDDAGFKTSMVGNTEWSIDATLVLDEAQATQTTILTSAFDKTTRWYNFRPRGAVSGALEYRGQGMILDAPVLSAPNDGPQTMKIKITGTGALTKAAQA